MMDADTAFVSPTRYNCHSTAAVLFTPRITVFLLWVHLIGLLTRWSFVKAPRVATFLFLADHMLCAWPVIGIRNNYWLFDTCAVYHAIALARRLVQVRLRLSLTSVGHTTTCLGGWFSRITILIGNGTFEEAIQAVVGWIEFLTVASFEVRVEIWSLTTIITAGN